VIERVLASNRSALTPDQLHSIEKTIRAGFRLSGTKRRHVDLLPADILGMSVRAAEKALGDANVMPDEIDLIIYVGVARGSIEPSNACVVQHKIGATNATSFDLLDACVSWLRALEVAQSMLDTGSYKKALVVNCEAGMLNFCQFELSCHSDLDKYFAGLTCGEAATATVLTASEKKIPFKFTTYPEHYDLCMIPLPNFDKFFPEICSEKTEALKFFSYSTDLVSIGIGKIADVYRETPWMQDEYSLSFMHGVSKRFSDLVISHLGLPKNQHFDIHEEYGNTVSASIPLGMSLAMEEGKFNKGDKALIITGGAGISVGLSLLEY